jgi:2-methylcitrate dehydratase PrpD
MSYTKNLANYAVSIKYEDIPLEVIKQAKLLILHTLGVAIAGSSTTLGKKQIELAKNMSGDKKESTILGDGSKVPCAIAGLTNGTLADVLDWEDCSWTGHPSSNAIPGALAVGEKIQSTGKEYLTAVIAAYDVYERIAMAVQPSADWDYTDKGWGLSSWVIYASAIAAGKILKLNNQQMENLIGIAGALTPISNARVHLNRTDFYHYQWGMNVLNGITGAFIAEKGISPMPDFLDGEKNHYWMAFSDQCRWDWFDRNLGKDYLIMETYIKHWPVNMWVNQPLDALDTIIKKYAITEQDIEEIVVNPQVQARMEFEPDGYRSIADAEFSIPYCLAMLLRHPVPGPSWYIDSYLRDPKILELASKVRAEGPVLRLNDAFIMFREGKYPLMSVAVKTKKGKLYKEEIPFPKGHPQNPMTVEEFKERFRIMTSPVLKQNNIEMALEKVMNLEKIEDLHELVGLLHNKPESIK